ncbi:hypothetical protein [Klebsiella pneumoniae]|uniref:hypothetical protein n=1 Tax=Klebsiella pneumoniae TaxID=573 RepID=UPI00200BDDC4|nr:hypothetical protein [Klebsiella pneumoniae]MCL0347998.1 hypothetical protein [Klebsiella pneumoniae]
MTSKLTRERIELIANFHRAMTLPPSHAEIEELARMVLAAMDSSEPVELPLDYLQGHKDGLEWAAQLAEANHPETGDWLYDDPIELAKAIRKGPDMPPVQPVADSEPVALKPELAKVIYHFRDWNEGFPVERFKADYVISWMLANYPPAQPAPVVPELRVDWQENEFSAGWNACRAAMLATTPQSPGSEPATVPGKWIPVSEQKPDCWCRTCRPVVLNDMRFVVCPDCGNKRCPRANDHRNACTGSNEPGQGGSAYPDTPREVKP